jgi:hypothetical protein
MEVISRTTSGIASQLPKHNEPLITASGRSCSKRCSLDLQFVRESSAEKTLDPVLQYRSADEKRYCEHFKTATECCANDGAATCAISEEEQLYTILYSQHHLGHSRIFLWFCPDV